MCESEKAEEQAAGECPEGVCGGEQADREPVEGAPSGSVEADGEEAASGQEEQGEAEPAVSEGAEAAEAAVDEGDAAGQADSEAAGASEADRSGQSEEAATGQADGESSGADSGIDVASVMEAVLFATDEPVTPHKLVDIAGVGGVREARKHIEELNAKYEQMRCAFRIEEIAGGYQMLTLSQYNPWLGKLVKVRSETKLSSAALETLAIVAYKQPILRVNIEAIRGVSCGEMVRQLCDKGLVKIVGRAEELGRPLLYGTTKKFLEVFGLSNLRELPQAQELKKPKGA